MLKKVFSFAVLAVLAVLPQCAFAQQDVQKILLVIRAGLDNRQGFYMPVLRAMELKKAGVEVRAVFEGEAVLYFLGEAFFDADPDGQPLVFDPAQHDQVKSTAPAIVPDVLTKPDTRAAFLKKHKATSILAATLGRQNSKGGIWKLVEEFAQSGVPYTLCAHSARQMDRYDALKKMGRPLSEDNDKPIPFSAYVKDGYHIVVY